MSSAWDQAAALLDAKVDEYLGDDIDYAANGVTFAPIKGFVLLNMASLGLESIDEIVGSRNRVKIAKAVLPRPERTHRLRHPRLGSGTFRPAGTVPEEQGRYWLFDVEKV